MKFVADTNVLVRLITGDDLNQANATADALERASLVAIGNTAFSELAWVLSSAYRYPVSEVGTAIRRLLSTTNVVADRPAIEVGLAFLDAARIFRTGSLPMKAASLVAMYC